MWKVALLFDERMFTPWVGEIVKAYFQGTIRASEAAIKLGWTRGMWESHLAGIFSVALNIEAEQTVPPLATIRVEET